MSNTEPATEARRRYRSVVVSQFVGRSLSEKELLAWYTRLEELCRPKTGPAAMTPLEVFRRMIEAHNARPFRQEETR